MEKLEGFDFIALQFDRDGKPTDKAATDLISSARSATDVVFLAHGFRNSEVEARNLYGEFLRNFRSHMERPEVAGLTERKFLAAGVFWPSKSFRETDDIRGGNIQSADDGDPREAERASARAQLEDLRDTEATDAEKPKLDRALQLLDRVEDDPQAQDEFVQLVLSLLDNAKLEETEGLDKVRSKKGSDLFEKLQDPIILPAGEVGEGGAAGLDTGFSSSGEGEAQGIADLVGSAFGAAGRFLNMTTWYRMKDRAGKVGANGVAQVVRALRREQPQIRIHLVGHSLGGRLMAACAKELEPGAVDSLTLLQAAFSHYGFSTSPGGKRGFFCEVLENKVVRGPILATYSNKDSVVGRAYAIASRLAGDNVKGIGDENDEYGGIGRNGTQRLQAALKSVLHRAGSPYNQLQDGVLINLDGSGGLVNDHGDVRNPHITYAFASAVARTGRPVSASSHR